MNLYAWCISMSSIPRQSSIYSKSFPTATYFTHYLFQPCHRLNVLKNVPSAERLVVVSFLTNIFFICGILWSSRFITNTHRATRGKKKEWKKATSPKNDSSHGNDTYILVHCFFFLCSYFFFIFYFSLFVLFFWRFFSLPFVCVCVTNDIALSLAVYLFCFAEKTLMHLS